MKKLFTTITIILMSILLSGCGSGGGSGGATPSALGNAFGTAQLGNLGDAQVKIYEILSNGSLSLLWEEKTSNGSTLNEIGKFNLHSLELSDTKYYVYQVSGGEDWDADDDEVKDANFTANKGVIRAVTKGSDLKDLREGFRVTYASEILFGSVEKTIQTSFDKVNLNSILKNESQKIIARDFNNDGVVDQRDLNAFNPVKNKNDLKAKYKSKRQSMIDNIHNGKSLALSFDNVSSSLNLDGYVLDIVVSNDGTKAYTSAKERRFEVIDLTDASSISVTGSTTLNYPRRNITYYHTSLAKSEDGKFVYVASNLGFKVVDVQDPSNPLVVGSLSLYTNPNNIIVTNDGNRVFIPSDFGLFELDVSDPTTPREIIKHSGGRYHVALSKDENFAFVSGEQYGLYVIDLVSGVYTPRLSTHGIAKGLVISKDGTKLFLCDGIEGILIYDVSLPRTPVLVGKFLTFGFMANDLVLSSDDSKIFVANGENGVLVVDVTDHSKPVAIANVDTSGIAHEVVLSPDNQKAYIGSGQGGIHAVDLSSLPKSKILTTLWKGKPFQDRKSDRITSSKDGLHVYFQSHGNINKMSIENPNDFSKISKLPFNRKSFKISSDETKVFAAHGDGGLQIIDISDESKMTVLGSFDTPGDAQSITVSKDENTAYVADGQRGLQIIDISNQATPFSLSSYDPLGTERELILSHDGTKIYLASEYRLHIIDVTNPASPATLASYSGSHKLEDLVLSKDGTKLYFVKGGFRVLDVTKPAEPTLIKALDTYGAAYGIAVSEDETRVYIANGRSGLQIIDITDLSNAYIVGNVDTPGFAKRVVLNNDNSRAYVADQAFGVHVIDIESF